MTPRRESGRWAALEARAHLPEVQEQIREAIREGLIRVRPTKDGGIRIVPAETRAEPKAVVPIPLGIGFVR